MSGLPAAAVPRVFSAPVFDEVHSVTGQPMSVLPPIPEPVDVEVPQTQEPEKAEEQPEGDEFPYHPAPGQRAGHARRVSVALKSKEDTDAAGYLPVISTRRESWMGHKQRDDPSHRVSFRNMHLPHGSSSLIHVFRHAVELAVGSRHDEWLCPVTQSAAHALKDMTSKYHPRPLHVALNAINFLHLIMQVEARSPEALSADVFGTTRGR